MSLHAGLRAYLLSQTAVTDLVDDRLHPSRLPDKPVLPAVVYTVVADVRDYAHDQALDLGRPLVQLDVWSTRQASALALADALIEALVGYRGAMGGIAYTAGWRLDGQRDLFEEETGFYRVSLDFRGWYEAVAA